MSTPDVQSTGHKNINLYRPDISDQLDTHKSTSSGRPIDQTQMNISVYRLEINPTTTTTITPLGFIPFILAIYIIRGYINMQTYQTTENAVGKTVNITLSIDSLSFYSI